MCKTSHVIRILISSALIVSSAFAAKPNINIEGGILGNYDISTAFASYNMNPRMFKLPTSSTTLGGNDGPSPALPVSLKFRSNALNLGALVPVFITIGPQAIILNPSTLGQLGGQFEYTYVYAINGTAGTEMAVSSIGDWDETSLQSTTATGFSSDDRCTLYSQTARSGVAIRYLGKFSLNNTTAGFWGVGSTGTANISQFSSPTISGTSGSPVRLLGASILYNSGSGQYSADTAVQSGPLLTVTTSGGGGGFNIIYPRGLFSSSPSCTITTTSQNIVPAITQLSMSGMSVTLYEADTNAAANSGANVICMGFD